MKKFYVSFAVLLSASAYAGGTVGGNPGVSLEQPTSTAFSVDSLPKIYVNPDAYRRVKARLSVGDVESAPVFVNGESIQVKRWLDSVVDIKISKEFLPESAK